MELHQAIGVIMGANIGTTVTGWLLSLSGLEGDSFAIQMLNPNAWAPILGFIGIFLYMLGKDKDRRSGVGKNHGGLFRPDGRYEHHVHRHESSGR